MAFLIYKNAKQVTGDINLASVKRHEIAVFESMRTYSGKVFREDQHLDRLFESAKTVGFSLREKRPQLKNLLRRTLQAYYSDSGSREDVFLRLTVREDGTYIFIGSRVHPPEIYRNGISLQTTVSRRSSSNTSAPEAKTSSYQNAVLGGLGPREDRPYEWLFLGADGYVAEVSIGNLFLVRPAPGGIELVTPPLQGILNGVTRRFVIECALSSGIRVKEALFTRHDVYTAQEVFLTNTSWEILPVKSLDGRRTGEKIPGAITSKLQKKFKQKVLQECRT